MHQKTNIELNCLVLASDRLLFVNQLQKQIEKGPGDAALLPKQ